MPTPAQFDTRRLAAFRHLELLARGVVDGMVTGLHRSPFKGFAVEFAQHRAYAPGDDLKHLDWKLLGKLDRHYVKQYEEDTSLRAWLVLDVSGSMGYASGGRSKLDCGRWIAGILAHLLLSQQDSVGLVTCDDRLRDLIPPRASAPHLRAVLDAASRAEARGPSGLAEALHTLAARVGRRALIVIISDFFDDPDAIVRALDHFAHKRHELILWQVLDPHETGFPFEGLTRFDSLEGPQFELADAGALREEYLRQFAAHQERLRRACHRLRLDFPRLLTSDPFEATVARYLAGRMRR